MKNALGTACCVIWAGIVLPFAWYWIFPDARGTFSFGQLLLAVILGPVWWRVGNAIGVVLTKKQEPVAEALDKTTSRRPNWSEGGAMIATAITAAVVMSLLTWFRVGPLPNDNQLASWVEFTSDTGGFSVLVPGTPKESEETRPILSFSLTVHAFESKVEGGPEMCVVSYTDYPEPMMRRMAMTPNEMLDRNCQGMEAGGRGKVIDVREISLSGYPGREVNCERYDQGGRRRSLEPGCTWSTEGFTN